MQASHDAPAWMGGSKQPLEKVPRHDEALLKEEYAQAFHESNNAPTYLKHVQE